MGLLYASGWQVGGTNTMTLNTASTNAPILSGYYFHGVLATADIIGATYTGQAYTSFGDAVAAALNLAAGPGYTCAWSTTTGLYTISKGGPVFAIDFSLGAAYTRAAKALGFAASNFTGATSYTSSFVPTYAMMSSIEGRTDYMPPMEPDDVAEETVSDGGVAYVITRKTSELLCSWTQQMEPFTSCSPRARDAASLSTWTWREFFQHTRGTHPFWCSDVLPGEPTGAFYQLTAKGAAYQGRLFTADFLDYTGVPFKTRWLGAWNG